MLPEFDRKKNLKLVQDTSGKNLTIALFKETNDGRSAHKYVWTMKEWKEVYLHYSDPTEYLPAIHLIGDWNHWKMITKSWGCEPFIKEWREEVKIKLRAEAIAHLREQAASPKGTAAARWLAEQGFEGKLPKKASKEIDEPSSDLLEHSTRMGIVHAVK